MSVRVASNTLEAGVRSDMTLSEVMDLEIVRGF